MRWRRGFVIGTLERMRLNELLDEARKEIEELFPWDLADRIQGEQRLLLLDVREPEEFKAMRIRHSLNVPRGLLEQAVEWDFEETVPELVQARDREIVIICRSGNRSLLAGLTMKRMGFGHVRSLATGLKGWTDYEQDLIDADDTIVDIDQADDFFLPTVMQRQIAPARRQAGQPEPS